jgi:hypothetical protein
MIRYLFAALMFYTVCHWRGHDLRFSPEHRRCHRCRRVWLWA